MERFKLSIIVVEVHSSEPPHELVSPTGLPTPRPPTVNCKYILHLSTAARPRTRTPSTQSTLGSSSAKVFFRTTGGAISHEYRHSPLFGIPHSRVHSVLVRQGGNRSMSVRHTRPAFIKLRGRELHLWVKSYNLHSVQVHRLSPCPGAPAWPCTFWH